MRSRSLAIATVAAAGALFFAAGPAIAAPSSDATRGPAAVPVTEPGKPPRGYRLTARQTKVIARSVPKVHDVLDRYRGVRTDASTEGPGRWKVSFFSGDREIAQVKVDDLRGSVSEAWTGHQVAWTMARGYPGAFGRKVNAPYVWLPLCALFLAGLVDWRRPFRIVHLDLLVLLGFGLSHYFLNRADIGVSVPLAYPPLLYLLGRMLWIGFRGGGEGLRQTVPVAWLAIAVLFLAGFRLGLNVADANVIDVGYSGVIGADRFAHGDAVYGNFPKDDQAGDTYGPVAYYAYVPFELAFPWHGRWDDLPAAHGAAIFFDLLAMGGLFLLGRRLRPGRAGRDLGVVLAFAWAAFPYTAYALESNANDALVAALLIGVFLVVSRPLARGALAALAGAAKFAPLTLVPLLAGYRSPRGTAADRDSRDERPAWRQIALFAAGFAAVAGIVMLQTLLDPGPGTFWDRTIPFQAGRESPFGIWGQADGVEWLQTAVKAAVVALALLVAFVPRRKTLVQTAALGAAVLIGVELTLEHWFYLYIVWFFPLLIAAIATPAADRQRTEEPAAEARAKEAPAALRGEPDAPDALFTLCMKNASSTARTRSSPGSRGASTGWSRSTSSTQQV